MTSTDTPKPTALKVLPDNIPGELQERQSWVVWRYSFDEARNDWTKLPYRPLDKSLAAADNPLTWTFFRVALKRFESGDYDGIGCVLSADDPYCGIDLDKCRDPETGEIVQWAQEIIAALNSYTEASPSGTGVKIWCKGSLPTDKSGTRRPYESGEVEMYHNRRYFTVTGHHLPGTPATIEVRQDQVTKLWHKIRAPKQPTPSTNRLPAGNDAPRGQVTPPAATDAEIIEKASSAKNGQKFKRLWAGDHAGYASQSEADQALACMLAFYTGPDQEAIDRLFRKSGLMREKWERDDYRSETLAKAVDRTEFYEWSRRRKSKRELKRRPAPRISAEEIPSLEMVDGRTEVANGRRMVAAYGEDFRYCGPWKQFLIWTGKCWKPDDCHQIDSYAKQVEKALWAEVMELSDKVVPTELEEIVRFARSTGSAKGIDAMTKLARSEPGVSILTDELDCDPFLLNVDNGTLDLRTGELHPHQREDCLMKLCPTPYDPNASCPTWLATLGRVFGGNQEMVDFFQRTLGYAMTGDVSEQCLFVLWGKGANGKSTVLNAVLGVLGKSYGMQAVNDLLMTKRNDSHPTEKADLFGMRTVCCIETEHGRSLAESLVKQLTGGDKIRSRKMRQDFWEFDPTHKVFLACNHKPKINGTDEGIWRRVKLLPFNVTIPPQERDKKLAEKLKAEYPGILAWMVRGSLEWQRNGLQEPAEVVAATESYRAEMDLIANFVDECCITGRPFKIRASTLYAAYTQWCQDQGVAHLSQRDFGAAIGEKDEYERYTSNGTWYMGLAIREIKHYETEETADKFDAFDEPATHYVAGDRAWGN